MGLNRKLVSQTTIKSDANKLLEQIRCAPYQLSDICPQRIHSVELIHGQWGAVGSTMYWNFVQDGKKMVSKEMIEAVEDRGGNKSIVLKVIGGDLLEVYEAFKYFLDCKKDGRVTLTLEYEMKNKAAAVAVPVPQPQAVMDVCLAIIKDIERHHLLVPN